MKGKSGWASWWQAANKSCFPWRRAGQASLCCLPRTALKPQLWLAWSREGVRLSSQICWCWGTLEVHVPTGSGTAQPLVREGNTWSHRKIFSMVPIPLYDLLFIQKTIAHTHPDSLYCIIRALSRDQRTPSQVGRIYQWRLKTERKKSDLYCIGTTKTVLSPPIG